MTTQVMIGHFIIAQFMIGLLMIGQFMIGLLMIGQFMIGQFMITRLTTDGSQPPPLRRFDPTRVYLGDAGFGQGRGGDVLDDHTYYGWYNGDVTSYYLDATPLSNQPYVSNTHRAVIY